MRPRLLAVASAAALALTGCGDNLDADSIEDETRSGLEEAGVVVEDVSCPSQGEEGETIECDVTLEGGGEAQIPFVVGPETVDPTDETFRAIRQIARGQNGG